MTDKRRSLYIGNELAELVDGLMGNTGVSFSGIINQMADRYKLMVEDNCPDWPEWFWQYLAGELKDAPRKPVRTAIALVGPMFRQALERGAHAKLAITDAEAAHLVAHVEGMDDVELIAIVHRIEITLASSQEDAITPE